MSTSISPGGRLATRTALVTGGGSGIGAAICLRFAEEGARVIVADWNIEAANEVIKQIENSGGQAISIQVDVADGSAVESMVEKAEEAFGPCQILVNAAGILFHGTVLETDDAAWNRLLAVNLTGVFHCCRRVLPGMIAQKRGSIINIASTTGGHAATARAAAYVASKGGVAMLTRALAVDHAKDGVRANAICPGPTDTPMLRSALSPADLQRFAASFPMGRLGCPEELAAAALFLASDESSFVTGSMLTVDGGQTATVPLWQ